MGIAWAALIPAGLLSFAFVLLFIEREAFMALFGVLPETIPMILFFTVAILASFGVFFYFLGEAGA
jgi:hypothetical protein